MYEIVTRETKTFLGLDKSDPAVMRALPSVRAAYMLETVHCIVERFSGVTRATFHCYDEASRYADHLVAD